MKIVYCDVNKPAKIKEIESLDLSVMQELVDGYIETYYPPLCEGETFVYVIVCNDEGKMNGMVPNRLLLDENGTPVDVVHGQFFICKDGEEDFEGFTDAEAEKVRNLYDHSVIYLKKL